MEIKTLLQELCNTLQKELNERDKPTQPRKVDFVSGLKPENYWLPLMYFGTGKPSPIVRMAWFVEIWIDGKCIFRQSHIPHESEDLNIVEGFLIRRVLRDAFTFGVMASKKFIDENTF